jgi:hypothetical protein
MRRDQSFPVPLSCRHAQECAAVQVAETEGAPDEVVGMVSHFAVLLQPYSYS